MTPSPKISPVRLVLGRIFFVYAALLFVATMLLVVIPVLLTKLLPEPRSSVALHRIFRVWMGVYLPLVFCPVRRRGTSHFRKGENYVVVCNHNSFLDVPVTSPWIPGANKTLAKIEISRVPIFGIIYTAGSILVDRKSEQSRKESFSKMEAALRMGLHLCLYPEGTRNKGGTPLQPFQKGAFITAIRSQKPIMPAVLSNTARILPGKPAFYAWPRPIDFHFLPPTETTGFALENASELSAKIHAQMLEHIVRHNLH